MQLYDMQQIRQRIAELSLRARRLLTGPSSGAHLTRAYGLGLVFEKLREYQDGDDFRAIDWKSSVRTEKLIVRSYQEERQQRIMLVVDTSASSNYSSAVMLKHDVIREVAVLLACASAYKQDGCGMICFAEEVNAVVPCNKGYRHSMRCAETIFMQPLSGKKTSLAKALSYIKERAMRNTLVIVITDGFSDDYQKNITEVAASNDVVVIRVRDEIENNFPVHAAVRLEDIESGATCGDEDGLLLPAFAEFLKTYTATQTAFFKKYGIDCLDITVGQPFDEQLRHFFRDR